MTHEVGVADTDVQLCPRGQAVQSVAPALAAYVPLAHAAHAASPVSALYEPALQIETDVLVHP